MVSPREKRRQIESRLVDLRERRIADTQAGRNGKMHAICKKEVALMT